MIFSIIIFSLIFKASNQTKAEQFYHRYNSTLIIKNFDNFNHLNLSIFYSNETTLRFISNEKLILDSNLAINLKDDIYSKLSFFEFYHLKGIDLNANIFQTRQDVLYPMISIKNSDFLFYNRYKIIDKIDCDSDETLNSFDTLFKYVPSILQFSDCIYSKETCILTFKNSIIKILWFNYFISSSLKKNYLQFFENDGFNFTINSQIDQVKFDDFYMISIDLNLLNDQVFKTLKNFLISGSISKIQEDIFSYFDSIEYLEFKVFNLKSLIHQGLSWTYYIHNTNNTKDIVLFLENYRIFLNDFYTFPDEDFCLFKSLLNYQKLQIVTDVEIYQNPNNFTCLFIGLVVRMDLIELLQFEWYQNCCLNDSNFLLERFERCMKINCSVGMMNYKEISAFDYYDILKIVLNFEIDFEFVLQPIISLVGIFVNFLVIFIIKNDETKEFQEKMYLYICYISIFNILILSIDFIDNINKCTIDLQLFCPIIRENFITQYLIIFKNFVENYLTFCSNFSILFFSIERFKKIDKIKSKFLLKIFNIFDKYYLKLILSIALMFSMPKFFEYKLNKDYQDRHFPSQTDALDFSDGLKCLMFFITLSIIDFSSNYLLHIFNFSIDIKMFFTYRKLIQKKLQLQLQLQPQKKPDLKDNSLLKFIILFSVFNILFRLPEFLLFIYIKYYKFKFTSKLALKSRIEWNEFDYNFYYKQNFDKLFKASNVLFKIPFLSLFFILLLTNKLFKEKVKLIFRNSSKK